MNHPFQYDATKSFALEGADRKVTVKDISYDVNGERIPAYLVLPEGAGPFPAVLFLHWIGEFKSSRAEFLDEALAYADKGVASLLVDGTMPWKVAPKNAEADRAQVIQQVVTLRRGLDLLAAQPEVDARSVLFVGHDFGAMHGMAMMGAESRIHAAVFMDPVPAFADWYNPYWLRLTGEAEAQYRATLADVDPITYAPTLTIPVFFQYAENDPYVPKESAARLYDSVTSEKVVRFYNERHELGPKAQADRMEWVLAHVRG